MGAKAASIARQYSTGKPTGWNNGPHTPTPQVDLSAQICQGRATHSADMARLHQPVGFRKLQRWHCC